MRGSGRQEAEVGSEDEGSGGEDAWCSIVSSSMRRSARAFINVGKETITLEVLGNGLESLVEAADDVEHEGAIGDDFAHVTEGTNRALELPNQ